MHSLRAKINRAEVAAAVMGDFLPSFSFDTHSSVLLVENYTNILHRKFSAKNIHHTPWNRRYSSTIEACVWPENGPYSHIVIRLSKSHEAFDLMLHAAASVAREDAEIIVYGMNDEGIKSARKKLLNFFGNCEIVGFKKGCRVLKSTVDSVASDKTTLKKFQKTQNISYVDQEYAMHSYPGLFNDGALDDGTALLLDTALPHINKSEKILDFACGTGIIAKVIAKSFPETAIDLLDNDSIALHAAQENLENSSSQFILSDSLENLTDKYDLIISNPPMHTEKDEHTNIIEDLITHAPEKLNDGGQLIIVTQTRLQLGALFTKAFPAHDILAQNTKYTIWRGTTEK